MSILGGVRRFDGRAVVRARGSRRRPFLRALATLSVVAASVPVALDIDPFDPDFGADVADAELIQTFTPPVFTTNTTGAIDIVGNALLTCDPNGVNGQFCAGTLAGTVNANNGNFNMIRLDQDDADLPTALSNQTTSSSRATFTAPAGSNVLYAGLYWSAESNNAARNRIDFLVPGGAGYQQITGAVAASGSLYQGSADVTALVQAAGNGDYWAGDIQTSTGTNRYAAWSMVVVYENPNLPVRNLSVFDGFGRVRSNPTADRTLDVPITGFLTPPFGPINAEIGVVAYEGDRSIQGDQVRIDTDPGAGVTFANLTDASNPTTNFGNGSITDAGIFDANRAPASVNNMTIDIDEFATVNTLAPAQTDTTVRFQTTGDWWYPGVLTTAIDLFVPEFPQVTKTVTDLNGGDALPGDQLEYSVLFENVGNDAARNSILRDVIPTDTTFVPGSVVVTNGNGNTNGGNGNFNGTRIEVPVGDGPTTGAGGGRIDPGEFAEISFRVTVDPSARGTDIENEATFSYTADTLNQDFTFVTNETVTPVPPLARLRIQKSGAPNPVPSGNQVTWTITVFNDGPNDATGVSVSDTMTNNTYASSSIPCTGGVGATTVDCAIGNLAAGTNTTFTITSDTPDDLTIGTSIPNTATVSGNEEDDQPFNDSATTQVQARPESDLVIVKTDVQDPVPAGGTIEYDITVTNNGPSAAPDVQISDQTNGEFNVTAVSVDGPTYTATCTLGSGSCLLDQVLEVGDSVTMSVTAQVLPFADNQVLNTAVVQSANPDPNGGNTTTETTDITPIADLSITKATTDAPVVAGEQVTYLLTVDNAGPSTAQTVTVTENLPAGLSLVSATPGQGSCTGTSTITCNLGAIGSGGQVQITVLANVPTTATGTTLNNSASVASPTEPAGNVGAENSAATSDTVTNEADLRIVKTVDANPLTAGGTFEFTLTVTNDGPSATSGNYTIADAVDASIFTVDAVGGVGCGPVSNTVSCTDNTVIPVGGSVAVTISGDVDQNATAGTTNTGTVSYPTEPAGADPTNNTSDAEITLVTEADVRIDKEWTSALVAGQNATFTLAVANDGLSAAENVSVIDSLPGGATFVSASSTTSAATGAVDCSGSSGSSVACSYDGVSATGGVDDALLNGDSFVVTVTVALPATADAGPLSNTASAVSSTDDRNPDNNSDTDVESVTRSADLTVTKAASDTTPNAGETITYTVTVTNAGPSTAASTFLGDPLPAGLTLDAGSIEIDGAAPVAPRSCSGAANAVSCDLDQIAVGALGEVTITYDATVDAAVLPTTPLQNDVSVNSPDDPTSNTANETITVGSEAELIVTKSDSVDPATPGGPLTYTITIENNGPSDARDVVFGDPVPTGYAATTATTPSGTCDTSVSCTIGIIPAGGQATITIQGTVDAGATGSLNNVTDVPTSVTTTLIGNDTGSESTALVAAADLTVSKSASPTTIAAGGGQVTYTIAVTNGGPSDAVDVDVDDTLPAGFVVDSVTPSTGTCASATTFPCDLGTVADGDTETVIIVGSFPSTTPPAMLTNTGQVTSPTDPNAQPGTPKTADAIVDVTRSSDVTVAKSGPISVVAGERRVEDLPANPGTFAGGLEYSIAVQNAGPSLATGVTLQDVLDTNYVDIASITAARISVSPASAGTCTPTGDTIDCTFGDVAVGDLITVTVNVDVLPSAPPGVDVLDNTAVGDSTSTDPTPGNNSSLVETDVTVAADLRMEKTAPAVVTAGETFDYTITVTNDGASDATGVVVSDTAPANVTFGAVSAVPAVCVALPCNIGGLAEGASVVITVSATVDATLAATDGTLGNGDDIVNTASVTSTSADPNSSNDSAEARSDVDREADMEIVSKIDAPDPVVAGQTISYTITARNNGPSTAPNAVISDDVPADTTLIPGSLPAGCTTTGNAPGSTITCDLGLLTSGQTVTRSFDVTVDSGLADASTVTNQAEAGSDETDPTPGNNNATNPNGQAVTTVGAIADVGIAKAADLATAVPGQPLTYTLTVTNAGPSTARGVNVTDDVSAIFSTVTNVSLTGEPAGASCNNAVACGPFDFPVGSFTIDITGVVDADITAALSNTADVSTTTSETGGTLPNSAVLGTPVAPSADVRLEKNDDVDPVAPNGTITYTIDVINDGPSDAVNVEVTDTLPAELTIVEVRPTAQCNQATAVCTIPSIAAGTSAQIEVEATVSDRAVGSITNDAEITNSDTPDPTPGNNTADETTAIVPQADVQVTKTTGTNPVVAGEVVRYAITIFNDGPASADAVTLSDAIPASAAFVNASSPVGTCIHDGSALGGTLTCNLGTLGDQTSIQIDVDVLLEPDATGNLVNTATATTTTDDPDQTNNNAANPNGTTTDPIVTAPDLRVRKTLVPADPANPDLVAGGPFEYLIEIFNDGPSTALADITLVDVLPLEVSDADPVEAAPHVVVLSNTTDCSYTDATNQIDCTFTQDLGAGDPAITLTVTGFIRDDAAAGAGGNSVTDNTATASTTDDDPNLGNNSGTAQATLVANADLVASKSFADASVIAGETTTFTISLVNNGPSVAANAVLADTLPSGWVVTSFANDVNATCTATLNSIGCTNASLAVGASMSVDVTALVPSNAAAGPVTNTSTAASDTDDRNPSNNSATDDVQITRLADLSIMKDASAASTQAGTQVVYTITVDNSGPSSAEATVVGDQLPMGMTIVAASLPGNCTAPGNVLTCNLGEILPTDPPVVITYTVDIDPSVPDGTTLTNAAKADSVTPLVSVPTDDADVDISTSADVEVVSKTVTPDPVVAGEDVTYVVTVRNNGPSIARNTTVFDDLPAFVTPQSPLPSGCVLSGTIDVSCNVGDLAVGQQVAITFDATVQPTTPTSGPLSVITNTASVSSDEFDPIGGNNNGSATTNVTGQAEITIAKTATPDPAVPGSPISYDIVVTNNGPSQANDVVVSDPIPAELSGASATSDDGSTCDATVSCNLTSLDVGETVTITVDATVGANVTTPIDNTATVTSSTPPTPTSPPRTVTITTPVSPVTDLGITKVLDTNPPVPGEQVQYTITVTNPGPSDAQSVTISDTIDAAVTNLVDDQAACDITGQDLACSIPTLAPGTFTVVVTGDLDEAFTGNLSNSATLTTTTDEGPNTNPNTATVNQNATPEADLVLVKTAAPDPVIAGNTLVYTLVVTNNGPSTAIGVQVDDALPGGLTLTDVSSSVGGCTALPCDVGDLVDGASATVTVTTQVDADVTDLQPNNASTTSTTADPTPGNNNDIADPVVQTSADLVTTKVLTTPNAVPGTRVSWTISVGNSGPSDATNVSVADTVPAVLTGVTVVSSQGSCTAFPCDLGTVVPGGSATITIEGDLPADTPPGTLANTALTTTDTPDPVPGDNNPTASNPIVPSADVRIVKEGPATDLVPGQPATFTITVTNDGPSDAQAVEFTDTLPAAIAPATITTSVTSGLATCDPVAGSTVTCSQTTLPPTASYVVEITGTVLASVTDPSVDNTADVTTTTDDPTPGNNTSTSNTPVAASADLSVAKALSNGFTAPIDPGAAVSYTITVTNGGPSDAQNVVVGDTLPSEITLGAILTAAAGATCDQGAVTCTIPTVAANSSVDVIVTGTMSDRAVGSVDNSATVTSDTPDPDPNDNDITIPTAVTPFADVQVTKSLLTGPLTAGTNDRYQIVVVNDGPATAVATVVTDALPAGVVFVSASSPIGTCTHSSGTVTCNLGDLPDQASVTITIDVAVEPDTSGTLVNLATATTTTTDPDPTNNDPTNPNGQTSDPVVVAPDLRVAKSLVDPQLLGGGGFTYEVVVTNDGPSDALADIVIVDTLPQEVNQALPITAEYSVDGGPDVACAPAATGGANAIVTCTVPDDLAVGEQIVVTITGTIQTGATTFQDNSVTVSTTDDDPDLGNNTATATTLLATDADLVLTKTFAGPASVQAGATIAFDLLVENEGPSDALNVQLDDILPAGFTISNAADITAPVGATCVQATTTVANDTLDCDLGTIVASTDVTVTVVATVDPSQPAGPVTNTATVASTTADRNPGSNTATDQVQVTRFADLDLVKTVESPIPPAVVLAGEAISYQIVFTNNGPSSAEGSIIGDPLSPDVTIVPSSVEINGLPPAGLQSCDTTGNLLTCELGEISPVAPGNTLTITYDVTVDPDYTGAPIDNTATANSPTPNDNPTDSTSTGVDTEADLQLVAKTSNPMSVNAGEDIEYTIEIRNNGPSVARDVVIDDDIPAGVVVQAASLPTGCSIVGGDVQCQLGDVPPAPAAGSTVTRTFTVTVDPDHLGDILNQATVSSPTTPEPTGGGATNTGSAPTTITTSADLVTTKVANPNPAVPGEPITYTVTVTNNGPSVARAVTVDDTDAPSILTGTIIGSWVNGVNSGACDASISCSIGDLPVGDAVITITGTVPTGQLANLVNTADAVSGGPNPTPDPNPGDNGGTASTPVAPVADITVAKTIDTDPLVPGAPMQFTITVTNNGPSDARSVLVSDIVDDAMTGLTTANADCAFTAQLLDCSIDRIEPGAGNAVAIVVTGDLEASFLGTFTNTVAVSTSTFQGPDAGPNSATATADAEPSADIALAKDASPDPVIAGELVTYLITATNNGPSDALGVVVTDTLPTGLTVDNVFSSQGACAALPCSLNTIADGGSATVTVVARVDSSLLSIGTNVAAVTATTPDPTGGNNQATEDVGTDTLARLTTEKVLSTPVAAPGGPVRWTVTVTNAGPSDALNVRVDDTLPTEVTNPIISSSQGGCTSFQCVLGTVAAGASATITIDADLPANTPPGDLVNTATTSSDTFDDDNTDDSSTATNPIVPAADLRIEKVGPTDDVVAGTPVSWTLTIVNDGPSDAQTVQVVDDLPAALDPATIVIGDGGATCSLSGLTLTCDLATLADAATLTITIDGTLLTDFTDPELSNTATVTSTTADPDPTDNSDSSTNDNAPRAEIVVTGTVTPGEVPAGTTASFEFEVVNDGPSDAANTTVTIPVPASVTISGTPTVVGFPGATVTVVDGVITVDIGDLPPGTPVTITFDGEVSPTQPSGPIAITATGSTTTNQNDTTNDAAIVTMDVVNDVNLTLTKTADSDTVRFGDEVTFTITLRNDGRSAALGATIIDNLPAGLLATSATSTVGSCEVTGGGANVECGPVDVPPNGGEIVVTLVADAVGDGMVANVASVECDCITSPIASAPAPVEIDRHADLGVTKTVFRSVTKPGFAVTYTITVANNGPDAALDTVVQEQLPDGLRFVSATPSVGSYDERTQRWTIGDLANGATATLDLRVVVLAEGNFTNAVSVSSSIEDRDLANNEASVVLLAISPDLPLTGSSTTPRFVFISGGLFALGAVLLLGSRRRRSRGDGDGTLAAT